MASLPADSVFLYDLAGKKIYYSNDPVLGPQIYSSDGTADGASLVADLPGSVDEFGLLNYSDQPGPVREWGFFVSRPSGQAASIFSTDGTAVYRLGPLPPGQVNLIDSGTNVSFIALTTVTPTTVTIGGASHNVSSYQSTLYGITGAPGNLTPLASFDDISSPLSPNAVPNFFDIGTAGTRDLIGAFTVQTVATGTDGAPGAQTYKTAFDYKIYGTDGTVAGTALLAEFSGQPSAIWEVDDLLFFKVVGASGDEFYTSDGTKTGTHQLNSADADYFAGFIINYFTVDNVLYFETLNGGARDLYSYDVTAADIKKVFSGRADDTIRLLQFGDRTFFELSNASGFKLYESNDSQTSLNLVLSGAPGDSILPVDESFVVPPSATLISDWSFFKIYNATTVSLYQVNKSGDGVNLVSSGPLGSNFLIKPDNSVKSFEGTLIYQPPESDSFTGQNNVVANPDGTFTILLVEYTSAARVPFVQRVTAEGVPIGPPKQLNSNVDDVTIGENSSGDLVEMYSVSDPLLSSGLSNQIYIQILKADGTLVGSAIKLFNSIESGDGTLANDGYDVIRVVPNADGSFLAIYGKYGFIGSQYYNKLYEQRISVQGELLGSSIQINSADQTFTTNSSGDFLRLDVKDDGSVLSVQALNGDFSLKGNAAEVFDAISNDNSSEYARYSELVANPDGSFTVLWDDIKISTTGVSSSTYEFQKVSSQGHLIGTTQIANIPNVDPGEIAVNAAGEAIFVYDGGGTNAIYSTPLGAIFGSPAPLLTETLAQDTGFSSSDRLTSVASMSGTGLANASIHFTIDGVAIGQTVTADSTGAWIYTPSLADGTHTIIASEADPSGAPLTASLTFTLDSTPPVATFSAAALSSGPIGDTVLDGAVVTLTGTASDTNDLVSVEIFNGTLDLGAATLSGAGTWTLAKRLAAGPYADLFAVATDAAGNHTSTTAPFTLVVTSGAISSTALGSTLTSFYDASGHLLQQKMIDTNGDSTTDRYGSGTALISQTIIQGGVRQEIQYAVVGRPYAGQNAYYDANDALISMTRTYADGDPAFDEVVHSDRSTTVTSFTPTGDKTISQFDAVGYLISSQSFAGTILTSSMTRTSTGALETVSYDPVSGKETSDTVIAADGSRTFSNFAVVGQSYAEQTATYDSAGHLLHMTRAYGDAAHTLAFAQTNNKDASGEVDQYDAHGRETLKIDVAANGSRDIFSFIYTDAATSPASIEQDHYGPGTKKQWSDITNPGGSHSQTAFAAGVILSSPKGTTDVFTSSSAGSDTFVFEPVVGQDIVKGFHSGAGLNHDTIAFDSARVSDFSHLQGLTSPSGQDTVITFTPTEHLLIKGVAPSALVAQNFTFIPHSGAGV